MYECEIGQGLLGNSVARAVGGAVQNATLPDVGVWCLVSRHSAFRVRVLCLVLSINLIHCGNEFRNSVPVRTLGL